MVNFSFDITGLAEFKDNINNKLATKMRAALRLAAQEMAMVWIEAIVNKAPRNSGFLAEHVTYLIQYHDSGSHLELKVGPTRAAFYAIFLEFGTAFMAAQPFLRPAYEEHKDEVVGIFARVLQEAIEKLRK